tara:strand:+ start:3810 stop:4109 length:300 start_codon:yes stop_codon:yes gene_type:complete
MSNNRIKVSLNIVSTSRGWRSVPVSVDKGTTERELAAIVESEGGIRRFDPYSERAVWGWGVTNEVVNPAYDYHISPSSEVAEKLNALPIGAYISRRTFK